MHMAFILDVYVRRMVGWCVAKNMRTELVLDVLEHAIWARRKPMGVPHHTATAATSTPPFATASAWLRPALSSR